jgi:hypothetical protein
LLAICACHLCRPALFFLCKAAHLKRIDKSGDYTTIAALCCRFVALPEILLRQSRRIFEFGYKNPNPAKQHRPSESFQTASGRVYHLFPIILFVETVDLLGLQPNLPASSQSFYLLKQVIKQR